MPVIDFHGNIKCTQQCIRHVYLYILHSGTNMCAHFILTQLYYITYILLTYRYALAPHTFTMFANFPRYTYITKEKPLKLQRRKNVLARKF